MTDSGALGLQNLGFQYGGHRAYGTVYGWEARSQSQPLGGSRTAWKVGQCRHVMEMELSSGSMWRPWPSLPGNSRSPSRCIPTLLSTQRSALWPVGGHCFLVTGPRNGISNRSYPAPRFSFINSRLGWHRTSFFF